MNWIPINWELVSLYNLAVLVLMVALAGLLLALLFPQVARDQTSS